jgi:hypothetical protein
MIENRKEPRYSVPEIYQKYIALRINNDSGKSVHPKLLNVSLSGIKMKNQFGLAVGSVVECLISIPQLPTKEIHFHAKIHYCIEDEANGDHLIGAEITQTLEELWVGTFFRIQEFINKRIRGDAQNLPAYTTWS